LGPLLFLLYINDLYKVCGSLFPLLFADDTNLFINGCNIETIESYANIQLSKIVEWLNANKLSLNVKKTHFMMFSNKKVKTRSVDIKINGENIDEVDKTKFLGTIIDNKLNWKYHLSYIAGKISRGIGIIVKARKVLNRNSLRTLYFTFIYPYLTYCNHVWGCTYISNLKRLIILQKCIIRIICGVRPRTHTNELFKNLNILKLEDINKYLIGKFMFKWVHRALPSIFDEYFTFNHDIHMYDTRQTDELHLPTVKLNSGKQSIKFRGPSVWNIIRKSGIAVNVAESVFSSSLKTFLVGKYICI
jgi:hypothetical protein